MVKDLNLDDKIVKLTKSWQIRCRVVKKHQVRHHSKGKLFKIDLLDELDGETMIEGTFYTDETDFFFDKIIEGKTYLISRAEISPANHKFTTIRNENRLIFKLDSHIQEVGYAAHQSAKKARNSKDNKE